MADKINFKLEYNGQTYRFASSYRGAQLFRIVTEHVATIVKEKGCELFWKDDDSDIVLETPADLSTAIDYAMYTRKNPSKTPRVHLAVVNTVVSQTAPATETQEEPAATQLAAPAAEIQEEEPAANAAAEALQDAAAFPLFDEDERQQHRHKLLAALGQQWVAINQRPGLPEMRKEAAEAMHPRVLRRPKYMPIRYRPQRCYRSSRIPAIPDFNAMLDAVWFGKKNKSLNSATSTFAQLTVAAMRANISTDEMRDSLASAMENAGITPYVAKSEDYTEEEENQSVEENDAQKQEEELSSDIEIVEQSSPAAEKEGKIANLQAVLQLILQQDLPVTDFAETYKNFIAREKELKIREKILQLKEETFERNMAIFQLKMEEFEQKFASLGKKVDDIEDKMDTEYLQSRMDEMEERLKKVEEKIDEDDMVIM